ncbi:MAG: class I SAM-dependent methyltransferase [Rhodospirillaceae bacterium]|nr:class I SAM-dependent methyltransferase [Rhodospirillales bacterium]
MSNGEFVERYDQVILHPLTREQYGNSGFYNVGRWSASTPSAATACTALVADHIERAELDAPGLDVVDVGCGLGDTTAQIAAACRPDAKIVGVNISQAQVAEAQGRHPGLNFRVMDATKLEFDAASVDRILSVEAVFHFDPRTAFLDAACRVLRPGGRMVITDVLFTADSTPWEWWVPDVNRSVTLDGYASLCAQAGFKVESVADVTAVTWTPFCAHLRDTGRNEAADRIEKWVSNYLLAVLTVP